MFMDCMFLWRKVLITDSPPLSAIAPSLEYFQQLQVSKLLVFAKKGSNDLI